MKYFIFTLIVLFNTIVFAGEKEKAQAYDIGHEAILLIEKGKYEKAMTLLNSAMELDPEHWLYPYELSLCYYQLKDFNTSKRMLDSLVINGISNPRVFQLLGNSEAQLGNLQRSVAIYENGIKKFPKAGRLYMELGLTKIATENYDEAEMLWEKSLLKQPEFDLTYYHLSKYLFESKEYFWSAIYGEMYLLLSYDSHKFEEISKLLWKNYQKLAKDQSTIEKYLKEKYQTTLFFKFASVLKKSIKNFSTIKDLIKIRKAVIEKLSDVESDNIQIEHLKKVLKSGHFEEYSFWLFGINNIPELQTWFKAKSKQYINFEKWNKKNRLTFNENTKVFIRGSYQERVINERQNIQINR